MGYASIQKKGDAYYVVFRDPVTRRQKWLAAGRTKREAKMLRNDIEGQLLRNEYQEPKKVTFEEFATLWLRDYPPLRGMKPSTLRDYESAFRCHLIPAFGSRELSSITLVDLQRFVAKKLGGELGPRRMTNIIVPLKTMFKYAVKWGYLKVNPALDLQKPKYDTPEMDFFTQEEAKRLIDAMPEYWRPLIKFMFMTGVRPGEAIAMRWKDVDLAHGIVNVRYTLDRGELLAPKTNNARRRIPIPAELVRALEDHRKVWPANPQGLIFVMPETATPVDLCNFRNRIFHVALENAGLRRIRLYDIRHSYAALMISLNIEPLQLSKNMGHYDLGFTYRTYGHLMPTSGHDDAAKLGALFADEGEIHECSAIYRATPRLKAVG